MYVVAIIYTRIFGEIHYCTLVIQQLKLLLRQSIKPLSDKKNMNDYFITDDTVTWLKIAGLNNMIYYFYSYITTHVTNKYYRTWLIIYYAFNTRLCTKPVLVLVFSHKHMLAVET